MPVYDQPLLFEIAFQSRDVSGQCDFIERMINDVARVRVRRVMEIGCGPGDHMLELARRGFSVSGFDLSSAMVKHADARLRREGYRGRLWVDDMNRFNPSARCDLAVNLTSTFNLIIRPADVVSHLESVAQALVPGGLYIVEMDHPREEARWGASTTNRWVEERDGLRVEVDWDHERRFDGRAGVWKGVGRITARNGRRGRPQHFYQKETVRVRSLPEMIRMIADQGGLEVVRAHGDFDARREFDESDDSWRLILTLRRKGR